MSFWFLATPYSLYPSGLDDAAMVARRAAGLLLRAGIRIFCPITHTHGIDACADARDLDFWIWAEEPFLELAKGCIILRAESWEISKGIARERARFEQAQKPIIYMDCWSVPVELRNWVS